MGFRSPWSVGVGSLADLEPDDRARFVDAAASAFARSHFRAEIAAREIDGDPQSHFAAVDDLLLDAGSPWPDRFRALCEDAAGAVRTSEHDLARQRIDDLIASLASNVRVQFIGGGAPAETRQRAVDGINTPLYPEVIIATSVLAEGLDLHRFCRRVIHHDLPWNPAKLEQRTGRVDRVGSLAERLKAADQNADARIEVWLPYVAGTYDEFTQNSRRTKNAWRLSPEIDAMAGTGSAYQTARHETWAAISDACEAEGLTARVQDAIEWAQILDRSVPAQNGAQLERADFKARALAALRS